MTWLVEVVKVGVLYMIYLTLIQIAGSLRYLAQVVVEK